MHRLDADTIGLMAVAKSERAYSALKRAFREREVDKRYHALVQGHPDPLRGTVDAPIARHPGGRRQVRGGVRRAAERHPLRHAGGLPRRRLTRSSWRPAARTRSGCTCPRSGIPASGDRLYGADPVFAARLGLARQWLHAVALGFEHPADGRRVDFTSDYPADLGHALDVLRAEG